MKEQVEDRPDNEETDAYHGVAPLDGASRMVAWLGTQSHAPNGLYQDLNQMDTNGRSRHVATDDDEPSVADVYGYGEVPG